MTVSYTHLLFFMIMSMVFLTSLLNLMNFAMMFNQIMSGLSRTQDIMAVSYTHLGSRHNGRF